MNPLFLVEAIIKHILDFFGPAARSHALTASFGDKHDVLRSQYAGFTVNGTLHMRRADSFRNLLVIGSTGSGKTTTCLLPSILHLQGSLVIHDPSGELYAQTAGALAASGYRIKVFNPSDPLTSDSFNVFAYGTDTSRIHKMARLLIHASRPQTHGEPIWDELATSIIGLIARALVYKPKTFHTLANIMHVLQSFSATPENIAALFNSTGDRGLILEFNAFMKYEEKLRTSVIATAFGALHYILDPGIASVTSNDTLDLGSLRSTRTALYIQNKIGEGHYYRPILSLFFETLFGVLFQARPTDADTDVFLLLDETSSLICPTLPLAIANLRKYRVGMLLVLQDFTQLVSLYGPHDAETIRSNCFARLVYGGGSLQSCEELSRTVGSYSYEDSDGIHRTRPLLTPDEIRMIPAHKALFFAGIHKPMMVTTHPFYSQPSLLRKTRIPHPNRQMKSTHTIPLYPLTIDISYGSPHTPTNAHVS